MTDLFPPLPTGPCYLRVRLAVKANGHSARITVPFFFKNGREADLWRERFLERIGAVCPSFLSQEIMTGIAAAAPGDYGSCPAAPKNISDDFLRQLPLIALAFFVGEMERRLWDTISPAATG